MGTKCSSMPQFVLLDKWGEMQFSSTALSKMECHTSAFIMVIATEVFFILSARRVPLL